jgi:hypothetical protein
MVTYGLKAVPFREMSFPEGLKQAAEKLGFRVGRGFIPGVNAM